MPRIKRWFPVSQDINADPEVWAMRHQIGEKALSVWLEFLSIADRNEGHLPGDLEELVRLVSGRCQASQRTVRAVYEFALSRLWLNSETGLKVANYAKYHRLQEHKKSPNSSLPSEPSEPYIKKDRNLSYIPKPKKTPYPENFNPSDGLRTWYSKQRVDDIEPHVEAFRDYHVSRASRFLDWEAAFRTWVRNIGRFNGKPQVQKDGELSDRIQRALRRGL